MQNERRQDKSRAVLAKIREAWKTGEKTGDWKRALELAESAESEAELNDIASAMALGAVRRAYRVSIHDGWRAKIDDARESVDELRDLYADDLDNAELGKAYRSARALFRRVENDAIADGFVEIHDCHRCGGAGGSTGWPGFTCYHCGGRKRVQYAYHKADLPSDPKVEAARIAKRRAKEQAEQDAFVAGCAALGEVGAALIEATRAWGEYESAWRNAADEPTRPSREVEFRASLAAKLRKFGSLSEAQIAAVQRGLERDHAREAEAAALETVEPLREGRYELEGEIVSHKWTEDRGYGSQHKMLVKLDDGNKVYGTVPRVIDEAALPIHGYDENGMWTEEPARLAVLRGELDNFHGVEIRGTRVRFAAQVERSDRDAHFGFFKRPTKIVFVGESETTHTETEEASACLF